MKFKTVIGRIGFFRGKGGPWLDMVNRWMLPVLGGGAATKYIFRDLEPWQAVALTATVAVVTELAQAVAGYIEVKTGATEEHYRLATETDPHRRESLRLLEEQKALLEALLVEVRRRQVVMVRLPEPPRPPGLPPAP